MTTSDTKQMEREADRFINALREELGKTGICQLTNPYWYALRQAYEAGFKAGGAVRLDNNGNGSGS